MAEISLKRPTQIHLKQKLDWLFFYLGLILLLLFVLQATFGWEIPQLETWQSSSIFKKWSGFALGLFIAAQWIMPIFCLINRRKLVKCFYRLHKLMGTAAPLVYYVHTTKMGYAYLVALSVVFFANLLVGLLSPNVVGVQLKKYRKQYAFAWTVLHVSLSFLTVGLTLYHVYVAYAYQ